MIQLLGVFEIVLLFLKLSRFEKFLTFPFGVTASYKEQKEKEEKYQWPYIAKLLHWAISRGDNYSISRGAVDG